MKSSLILISPKALMLAQAYNTGRKLYVLDPPVDIPAPNSEVDVVFSPKDKFLGLSRVMPKVREDFWLLGNQDVPLLSKLNDYESRISNYSRLAACHVSGFMQEDFRDFVPYLGTWYCRQSLRDTGYLEEHLDYSLMASRWGDRARKSGWVLRVIHDPDAPNREIKVIKPQELTPKNVPKPEVTVAISHWGRDLALLDTVLAIWKSQDCPLWIHVIDTGSEESVRETLAGFQHEGIQVSLLQNQGCSPEDYECLALDHALRSCITPKLVFCHVDVFPRSPEFLRGLRDRISYSQPVLGIQATPTSDLISTALVALDVGVADSIRLTANPRWLKNQYGVVNPQFPFLALNASLKIAGIKPLILDDKGYHHIEHVVKIQNSKSDSSWDKKNQEVTRAIQEALIRLSRSA